MSLILRTSWYQSHTCSLAKWLHHSLGNFFLYLPTLLINSHDCGIFITTHYTCIYLHYFCTFTRCSLTGAHAESQPGHVVQSICQEVYMRGYVRRLQQSPPIALDQRHLFNCHGGFSWLNLPYIYVMLAGSNLVNALAGDTPLPASNVSTNNSTTSSRPFFIANITVKPQQYAVIQTLQYVPSISKSLTGATHFASRPP